jgi:hypothetical protein
MVNYSDGKVYKITSPSCDLVYIGSTTQSLSKRIGEHRKNYKRYQEGKETNTSSFEIIKYGDAVITLIEAIPCNSKEELLRAERKHIEKTVCVNKIKKPIVSRDEVRERDKEYKKVNSEKIKQQNKDYRQANSEKIKEKLSEYYKNNAKKIIERGSTPVLCDKCGRSGTRNHMSRHKKSQKCLNHTPVVTNSE